MAIDAFGERNRVSDAHSKVPLSGAIRDEFKRAMALNKIDYDKLGEWAKAHEALMRVALFKESTNPYIKGRLAQQISDSSYRPLHCEPYQTMTGLNRRAPQDAYHDAPLFEQCAPIFYRKWLDADI